MAQYDNIFTNRALSKMKQWQLSESQVLDAYNSGDVEKSKFGGWNAIKKYQGYEIGVYYVKDGQTGQYKIVSVWKRNRR